MRLGINIITYNHANFIDKRIESIFQQSLANRFSNISVFDDFSTDDTISIIKKLYKIEDIHENSVNTANTFVQWNKAVLRSEADLVWVAEGDDYCEESFLEKVVNVFEQNPQVGLVYAQSNKVDVRCVSHGTWLSWTMDLEGGQIFETDFIMDGKEFIKKFLIKKNVIPNASAVVFRRELYEAVGGADESIRYCSDWLTWLKILTKCDVGFVAEPLNYFRFHDNSVIATAKGHMLENDIPMRLKFHAFLQQENLEGLLNESARMLEHDYLNLGIYYYHHGEKLKGIVTIVRSISYAENKFATAWTRLKYITGLLLKWVPNR